MNQTQHCFKSYDHIKPKQALINVRALEQDCDNINV